MAKNSIKVDKLRRQIQCSKALIRESYAEIQRLSDVVLACERELREIEVKAVKVKRKEEANG